MATEAQKAACRRYYKKMKDKTRVFLLRYDREKDADVIKRLDEVPSKTDYIRSLIRRDM